MSASVKLRFLDEDGVTEHSKRFAVSDDSSTVGEAIQNGLDRLECTFLTCQLVMHGQRRGSGKPFRVRMDDYIELGYDYVFVDPRLEDSNIPAFSTPSTPTTSSTMAFKSPAAVQTPTTPTTSRKPFARRRSDSTDLFGNLFDTSSMAVPPPTPTTPTRGSFAKLLMAAPPPVYDPVIMDDGSVELSTSAASSNERPTAGLEDSIPVPHTTPTAMANLVHPATPASSTTLPATPKSSRASAAASLMTDSPKVATLSKTKQLSNFYIHNKLMIDDYYGSKADTDGRMFHDIDVISHFGLFQHQKTAFVVLCQQKQPELYEAAEFVVTDACMDILRLKWPKLNVPPTEKQSLAHLVSALTGYDQLKNMTMANRNGRLDYKIKHFRRQNPDSSVDPSAPPAKRTKMADVTDNEIDLLSIEINPETDSKVLHRVYESTAIQRTSWIMKLHSDPELHLGMITKLVSKFRHFVSDLSLLRYDFNVLMSARRQPLHSLAEKFRHFVPAICEHARILGIPTDTTVSDSTDKREYMAGHLLAEILKTKCKKSPVEYSRLVMDHTGSIDYKTAMDQRKANGITAPTILIIGIEPAVSFYVAADDIVFLVRGRFAEALQSFMEIVFVSNVKYDPKTIGITYFFEYLMNIKEHQTVSRMAVSKELEVITEKLTTESASVFSHSSSNHPSGSLQVDL